MTLNPEAEAQRKFLREAMQLAYKTGFDRGVTASMRCLSRGGQGALAQALFGIEAPPYELDSLKPETADAQ